MLFIILATDNPGAVPLRAATRESHLAYLAEQGAAILHGGPLVGEDGVATGSLLVVEVADRDAAVRLAEQDPYTRAGLFQDVSISAHRLVIRDGQRVG